MMMSYDVTKQYDNTMDDVIMHYDVIISHDKIIMSCDLI